ncbi:MAG TPA: hypothetical protein VL524_19510, partial [Gemmatimonadaceae bacterium]|nr:hypothetical protein [Gemmatimonadaceae bacterium]
MSPGEPRSATPVMPVHGRDALLFHGARIGVGVVLAVLTFILFPASPAIDFPIYEIGSVASDNVIAPFAFRVLKTPAELQAEQASVVRGVEPVYVYVPAALDSARASLTAFGNAIRDAATSSPQSPALAVQRAASSWGIRLSTGEAQYLAAPRRRDTMLQAIERVFDRWLSAGVASAGSLDSVRGVIVVRSGGEDHRLTSDSVATFTMLVSRARL